MAFLRFTRDKRGYEHFSLVEATTTRRGKSRTRVLYWYRTPPNVRVGREPFDESVRRALEAQNPNVQFDWRKIVETPIPSPETERWRERRRAEKAEKTARRGAFDDDRRAESPRVRAVDAGDALDAGEEAASDTALEGMVSDAEQEITAELIPAAPELSAISESEHSEQQPDRESTRAHTANEPRRGRRRRRGRRGRHGRDVHTDGQTRSADAHESSAPLAIADPAADDAKPEPEGE
jgi:hypothetical protein